MLLQKNRIFNNSMDSNLKQTICVGGRQMSNTIEKNDYEKVDPKTQKVVKVIKGKCDI